MSNSVNTTDMSGASAKAVETGIKVLAGDYPAKGKLIYDLKLK